MRITVVTSLYPGPSRPHEGLFAERRWQLMRARGHAVSVIHPLPWFPLTRGFGRRSELARMPGRELRAGIPVARPRYLHWPGSASANARRFARAALRELLAGERPDVVVADYAWPASCLAPELATLSIPCVVSGRGSDVLQVAAQAELGAQLGRNLVAARHWCGVSADLVSAMDRLACASGRGRLVPNGVDLETFCPRDRREARAALDLAGAGPLVLVVGHLIQRKDPLLALEVFARSRRSDARCAFIGRGALRAALETRVRALALGPRVSIVGEVAPDRLAHWYAAADVLLLTSLREGRPNVVLEALACGRPVLATEAGGTRELLVGWEERLFASTRDPVELARRLDALLADPPPPAALRALVEPWSWERSLDALEAVLGEAARA
jgi:glycosyltransferase involved in cell wall biosynthesis